MKKTKTDLRREVGQQLSFALYGAANRVARLHKPFLEPLGLTFPQYLVLLELYSGAPRSVGELGLKLAMDTGTITPLLKRMHASGLVTRVRDTADERRVLVDLSPRAQAMREDVWSITDKIKAACKLTNQGIDQLRQTLEALAHPAPD
jgi:DNA-binding MarR family transcriptional regulator